MVTDHVLILGCCAGGSALGYAQAGIPPIGFEINPKPAEIARANLNQFGAEIHIQDYRHLNFNQFAGIKHAQFSFPCQGFSIARKGKNLKPRDDMDLGLMVGVPAIETLGSSLQTVVLENVRAWGKSESYRAIVAALHRQGFHVASGVVDMSYHNCPQSRERLIVVASKEWLPCFSGRQLDLLNPEESTCSLVLPKLDRQTWWDALHGRYGGQDLMPQLEESWLSPRQQISMNRNPTKIQLIATSNASGLYTSRLKNQPCFTLTCSIGAHNALPRIYKKPGGVYRINIPHLARLATFPDWWQWGESRQVAGDAIGDCIPPAFMKFLLDQMGVTK